MFDTGHLHPMIVHFPIALTMVGAMLETVRFFFGKSDPKKLSSGELLLYFATASALLALLTGFLFTSTLSGKALEVRNLHVLFAIMTTVSLLATSFFYLLVRFKKQAGKTFRFVGLLFYIVSALLTGAAGYMGGTLVYTYMIGI
ncbi:MAG: hypothetical protein LBH22_06545 [Bacteroidales bacterium]|nr:hypothetical protein [Bacteroidales bacterium]